MIADGLGVLAAALSDAFSAFRADLSDLVPEIYAWTSTADQSEITIWWQNTANQVIVNRGYLLQPAVAPQVSITIGAEQETDQFAGEARAGFAVGIGQNTAEVHAAYFRTRYDLHCFGPNQNFVLWLQMLVKWALLYERQSLILGAVPSSGPQPHPFTKQVISAGDFQPVPDAVLHEGIYPFERVVSLTAEHVDTWSGTPRAPMSGGSVTVVQGGGS